MHVTSRPIEAPVALFEEKVNGGGDCLRVLIFQEGLLPARVVEMLDKMLRKF